MSEWSTKQAVETSASTQQVPFNVYFEELDVNTPNFGIQGFVYKNIFDAGVATAKGSPVGCTNASGGSIVTPDFSDTSASAMRFRCGGIAAYVVAANTNAYGWVQSLGCNRVPLQTTGAVAAGAQLEWTDDFTVAAFSNAQNIFGRTQIAAASGFIAAGGAWIYG